MKKILLICFLVINSSLYPQEKLLNLTKYVNPFVGTGGHGHTFPGATVPFGMVQLSPDTRLEGWDGCSGYHYSDSIIYGFSHTHLSGTGVSDYCDILIMPVKGKIPILKEEYSSVFSHSDETASPGYYSVYLKKPEAKVELSATARTGIHKYTFKDRKKTGFMIDLEHRDEVIDSYIHIISNREISGMRRSSGWAKNQTVYFYIRFSKPFDRAVIIRNDTLSEGFDYIKDKKIKAYIGFDDNEGEAIYIVTGISAVSEANAKLNLIEETKGKNFEEIRINANNQWNKYLNKIQVKSKDEKKKRIFYTALYHTAIHPNLYNDVDGSYLGRDFKIHKIETGSDYYTVFSLWDTYRANHPLLSLIEQKRTLDFLKTFLLQYEQGGRLPVWELAANETDCMIGYHSVPVIVDAYVSGIKNFNTKKMLEAMIHSSNIDKFGLDVYRKYGYIPGDKEHESVSKTLEYAYDDWCISEFLSKTGLYINDQGNDIEKEYLKRSRFYKNVFDVSTGFMRPRFNGGWKSNFDPRMVDNNYTEANSWQYSFYVPHDVEGFKALLGGNAGLELKLDSLFKTESKITGREQVDITGLIGQYAHGNEPSHHIAYLYNYTGRYDKTQEIVRKIMNEFYSDEPDGLIGNEDCGQMSAWYVLSAIGIYPVCPGDGLMSIGSPIFEEIKMFCENQKVFTIKAKNVSDKNLYIKSIKQGNNNYEYSYIKKSDIIDGLTYEFEMDSKPNLNLFNQGYRNTKNFDKEDESGFLVSPVTNTDALTFYDSIRISLSCSSEGSVIYYTTDGRNPELNSIKYTNPITFYQNTFLKSIAYLGNKKSFITESEYYLIPKDVSIKVLSTPNPQYTAGGPEGLIDGIRGFKNWRLGRWQGYQGQDFEAIIDLGKTKIIGNAGASFLQDARSWIWMPVYLEVYISVNGTDYSKILQIDNDIADTDLDVKIKEFRGEFQESTARYVKFKAKNYGKIPLWHAGAGYDAFIFIDEVFVS